MTTKHTSVRIIDYLRTLREGDVLTAIKTERGLTKGFRYAVLKDYEGDLYIENDEGSEPYIHIGESFDCLVSEYFQKGIFEIPFEISVTKTYPTDVFDDKTYYIVHATVDGEGLERLLALSAEGRRNKDLTRLKAERDEIQRKIEELEAV